MVFNEIYKSIQKINSNKPIIIAICGNQGAGKTIFSNKFEKYLRNKKINVFNLASEAYFIYDRDERKAFLEKFTKEKKLLEWPKISYKRNETLLLKHLKMIKSGKNISEHCLYNTSTGKKDHTLKITLDKHRKNLVLLVGTFILDRKFRKFLDITIFINTPTKTRFERIFKRAKKRKRPKKYQITKKILKITDDYLEDYFNKNKIDFNFYVASRGV